MEREDGDKFSANYSTWHFIAHGEPVANWGGRMGRCIIAPAGV